MDKVTVKQQREIGSRQWGVYVNGVLIEGGFFSRGAASIAARMAARGLAADQRREMEPR